MQMPDGPELDALADVLWDRIAGRLPGGGARPGGPLGPFAPERPNVPWDPHWEPRPELLPRRRLGIAGVELTQSTQHHGAAGTSYGDDNSVPLVALKPLVARVYPYVSAGLAWPDALSGQRVTGELVLSVGERIVYRTGPTRSAGARVGPQRELSRTLWDKELSGTAPGPDGLSIRLFHVNCSLNFAVPAWYCRRGRMHVSVRIWRVSDGPGSADSAVFSQYAQLLDVPAPRLCLVRVNWTDAAGNTTRPTDQQMLDTTSLAERMLPFPYFETTILGVEQTSGAAFAMVASGGGCNTAWNDLLTDLAVTQIFTSLFGLGDIVFGMVPAAAIPATAGSINSGCGRSTGGCFVGFGPTFAHEIGHLYGRPHVGVAVDTGSDANYPDYGGSKTSIGEVGLDTGTSPTTLYDPDTTGDIMSYEAQQWISPYTYRRILEARASHQSAPADPRRVRSLLYLDIRLHRGWKVELTRALRVEAPGTVAPRRGISPLSIDLRDRDGRVLSTHHCVYVPSHGGGSCGCADEAAVPLEREPYLDLHEVIEWPEGIADVVFHRGGEPLATVEVGAMPTVAISGPETGDGRLTVRVRAEHAHAAPSVAVLFSADDGDSWQPVAFDPADGQVSVEADRLPGGERCRFRAVATAELQVATADTEPFAHDRTPRRLHVVTPPEDCGIEPGPVALRALVDTRQLGPVLAQQVRWRSDLEGELGAGLSLLAELGEGTHEVTVTAPDGLGGTMSERAIIIVGGRPVAGR